MCFNAFNKEADLDVLDHPILNFFYYLVRVNSAKHEVMCSEFGNSKLMPTNSGSTIPIIFFSAACRNSPFISCLVHSEEDSCKTTAISVSPPQQRLEIRHSSELKMVTAVELCKINCKTLCTPSILNCKTFDFFSLKFDHSSYSKNLCKYSQI